MLLYVVSVINQIRIHPYCSLPDENLALLKSGYGCHIKIQHVTVTKAYGWHN